MSYVRKERENRSTEERSNVFFSRIKKKKKLKGFPGFSSTCFSYFKFLTNFWNVLPLFTPFPLYSMCCLTVSHECVMISCSSFPTTLSPRLPPLLTITSPFPLPTLSVLLFSLETQVVPMGWNLFIGAWWAHHRNRAEDKDCPRVELAGKEEGRLTQRLDETSWKPAIL